MVYDPQNNDIYLFGGFDGTVYLDDFYRFDVGTLSWSQVTPISIDNPPSTSEYTMLYKSTGGRIYMFGGIYLSISDVKEYRADFWSHSGATARQPTSRAEAIRGHPVTRLSLSTFRIPPFELQRPGPAHHLWPSF